MNKEEIYLRIGENEEEIQRLEGEILHRCKRIADKEAVENDYGMLHILLGKRATYTNDTRRLTVLIERQSIDDGDHAMRRERQLRAHCGIARTSGTARGGTMNGESKYFDQNGATITRSEWLVWLREQERKARDVCASPIESAEHSLAFKNYCTLIEDLDRLEAIREAVGKETPNESDANDTSEPYITGEFMSIVDAARYADAWRVGWTEIAQERQVGSITITATIRRAVREGREE